jgi:hypothetical protein
VLATVVVRWRAAEPQGSVARAREGQGQGAMAVAGVQVTRGVCPSRRWRRGGAGTMVSITDNRWQRKQRSRLGCQRKKKREGGPRDSFAKNRKI